MSFGEQQDVAAQSDSSEQIWSATHPKAKDTSSDTDPHSLERRLTQDDFETPEAAA
jgi:hypothetical protein